MVVEREISNSGDEGSVLSYELDVDYELNGEGYISFDGEDDFGSYKDVDFSSLADMDD